MRGYGKRGVMIRAAIAVHGSIQKQPSEHGHSPPVENVTSRSIMSEIVEFAKMFGPH
jgi:hypothetical protein